MTNTEWIHGSATIADTPKDATSITNSPTGLAVVLPPAEATWFHIALPTPSVVDNIHGRLVAVHLLTGINHGGIDKVRIYDGGTKVEEFDDVNGAESTTVTTVTLSSPHPVGTAISVSFHFQGTTNDGYSTLPPSTITIEAVGADYEYAAAIVPQPLPPKPKP